MDRTELLQRSRWEILRQIALGNETPAEIAAAAKTSLPNTSQQLRLLEAHDLIQRGKEQRNGPGKPRSHYTLKKPLALLTVASERMADQHFLFPNELQQFVFATFFLPADEQPFLLMALCKNPELLEQCSIAYVRSTEATEVLFLTDDVDRVRSEYSNMQVTYRNKARKIVAWTHSVEEMNDGIARKDEYFLHLTKHRIPVLVSIA